jgi:hypothetical protein
MKNTKTPFFTGIKQKFFKVLLSVINFRQEESCGYLQEQHIKNQSRVRLVFIIEKIRLAVRNVDMTINAGRIFILLIKLSYDMTGNVLLLICKITLLKKFFSKIKKDKKFLSKNSFSYIIKNGNRFRKLLCIVTFL